MRCQHDLIAAKRGTFPYFGHHQAGVVNMSSICCSATPWVIGHFMSYSVNSVALDPESCPLSDLIYSHWLPINTVPNGIETIYNPVIMESLPASPETRRVGVPSQLLSSSSLNSLYLREETPPLPRRHHPQLWRATKTSRRHPRSA